MSALTWIGVALLGGCAAVARVTVDAAVATKLSASLRERAGALAIGTFLVNTSGSFLLGLLDGLAVTGDASILVGTAAIGAYTTFSTWILQSQVLTADGLRRAAILNVLASVAAGFAAVLLGRAIGTVL